MEIKENIEQCNNWIKVGEVNERDRILKIIMSKQTWHRLELIDKIEELK